PVPHGNALPNAGNAIVINEYRWLWLNREGAPTTATDQLYLNLLGPNSTAAQRFHLAATYLAADTEFCRAQHDPPSAAKAASDRVSKALHSIENHLGIRLQDLPKLRTSKIKPSKRGKVNGGESP